MSDNVYVSNIMKNYILSSLSAVAVIGSLMLSSCSPVTTQTRIEKNASMYERLPESHKSLVNKGQIKKGMHKDGVFLAWGRAKSVAKGSQNGENYERWIYTSSSPVYHHGINPYIGNGWGRRGWGRGSFYGIGINPRVTYVQRKRASVNFNQYDKVDSWEERK